MMRESLQQSEFIRFLLAGVLNTLLTYGAYLLLNLAIHYQLAYGVAYVGGIVFSYWLNSRWVFRTEMTWKRFLSFPMVYVFQYALGAALLYLLVEMLHLSESLAPLLVIAVSVPVTFVLSRFILKR